MPGGLRRPPPELTSSWNFNYVDPPRGGRYVVIATAVLLTLTYCVVALRLWARFRYAKSAGIDDALILATMIPLTGMAVSVCLSITTFGMGRHVWNLQTYEMINARKISMVSELLYMLTTCTTKVSVLLFYRRLAAGTITSMFQWMCYASIAFVIVYFITFSTDILLMCTPPSSFWLQSDSAWLKVHENDFHCQDEGVVLVISATISAFQDVLACCLPMVLLWKLQIPKRQKYALGAIFSAGIFLCICAVLRCVAIFRTYYRTYDMTWQSQQAWLWLSIEAHLAVVCASAPALKTFFKHSLKDYTYGFRHTDETFHVSDPPSRGNGRSAFNGGGGGGGEFIGGAFSNYGRGDARGAVFGGSRSVGSPGNSGGGAYGGRGGGGIITLPKLPKFGARTAKSRPWEIRLESEHELVYIDGKVPRVSSVEMHYTH
ncbi:hypothetical protein EG327_010349 [Venturia inaequalis]|uniref:Rhodopsin domain-containing protein n=1 Tax=Venturia inaequalis TaxID=5025 RepID=A0A8H3UIU9_VENIN|nr:hypothetical protein EG327_010349 [Venturia inaequalis]